MHQRRSYKNHLAFEKYQISNQSFGCRKILLRTKETFVDLDGWTMGVRQACHHPLQLAAMHFSPLQSQARLLLELLNAVPHRYAWATHHGKASTIY